MCFLVLNLCAGKSMVTRHRRTAAFIQNKRLRESTPEWMDVCVYGYTGVCVRMYIYRRKCGSWVLS